MKNIETAVYAARGNAAALERIEEKLAALLELVRAFREEVQHSEWAKKNLKGAKI